MSGHVFHPGHEALHGITVVVDGASGKTYLGRYHEVTPKGILFHDAAVHDPATAAHPRAEWLRRADKFGVPHEHRVLVLPEDEVTRIVRFEEALGATG